MGKVFWDNDVPLHIHVNGDAAISEVLDTYDVLRTSGYPGTLNNRVVLHHVAYADPFTDSQIERIRAMRSGDNPADISVSMLPYYFYALGKTYVDQALGDRAYYLVSTGLFIQNEIPVSLHSDFGMAPPDPLFTAWCAINRKSIEMVGADGYQVIDMSQNSPDAMMSFTDAIRGVTIEAARTLGLDKAGGEYRAIGSIEVGKNADFVILNTTLQGLETTLKSGDRYDNSIVIEATVKDGVFYK